MQIFVKIFTGKDLSSPMKSVLLKGEDRRFCEDYFPCILLKMHSSRTMLSAFSSLRVTYLVQSKSSSSVFLRFGDVLFGAAAVFGELVGPRLIAHGGSLINLAKQPGSTVQFLGAEKALFRALKTKHATPKYGLIYHASLIGQAAPKLKGKISRTLDAKTALAIRCDALGEVDDNTIRLESRLKVEARLRNLEGRELGHSAGSTKGKQKIEAYDMDRKKGAGALITPAKGHHYG